MLFLSPCIQPQLSQRPLALGGNRRRGSWLPGRAMGETAVAVAVVLSRSGLGGDWHGRLPGLPGPALAKLRQNGPYVLEVMALIGLVGLRNATVTAF